MSHTVITCTCATKLLCPVPGHVGVPRERIAPSVLVEAGEEATRHLIDAERSLIAARAAWVSRGLSGDDFFPKAMDLQTMRVIGHRDAMRRWTAAAKQVADRRTGGEAQ